MHKPAQGKTLKPTYLWRSGIHKIKAGNRGSLNDSRILFVSFLLHRPSSLFLNYVQFLCGHVSPAEDEEDISLTLLQAQKSSLSLFGPNQFLVNPIERRPLSCLAVSFILFVDLCKLSSREQKGFIFGIKVLRIKAHATMFMLLGPLWT